MSTFLLDVNVLIALSEEGHVAYGKVHRWLKEAAGAPWATCPLTQAGFVRIITNPGFHPHPVTLVEAFQVLDDIIRRAGHRFWPLDITLSDAVQPFQNRVFGHRQVSDAYLLGLAIKRKGRVVTLDHGIATLAGREFAQYVLVLR